MPPPRKERFLTEVVLLPLVRNHLFYLNKTEISITVYMHFFPRKKKLLQFSKELIRDFDRNVKKETALTPTKPNSTGSLGH